MNNKQIAALFISITLIQIVTLVVLGVKLEQYGAVISDFTDVTERFQMYDKSYIPHIKSNGVYFKNDDYYCIWVKDRDPLEVSKTEAHEYCHYLIDNGEKDHFCGKD